MDTPPGESISDDGRRLQTTKRRPGRPRGAKNKKKLRISEPTAAAFSHHVLTIPAGSDISEFLTTFVASQCCADVGIYVLTASGSVVSPVIRHTTPFLAAINFSGRFNILSISAAFLPGCSRCVSVVLAGPEGKLVGGVVEGPLLAAETVVVVVATFANPTFHDAINVAGCGSTSSSGTFTTQGGGAAEEELRTTQSERHEEIQGELRGYYDMLMMDDDGGCDGGEEYDATFLHEYAEEMMPCFQFPAAVNVEPVLGGDGGNKKIISDVVWFTDSCPPLH